MTFWFFELLDFGPPYWTSINYSEKLENQHTYHVYTNTDIDPHADFVQLEQAQKFRWMGIQDVYGWDLFEIRISISNWNRYLYK